VSRPEVQLIVTARPVVVPPCSSRFEPQALSFGPVAPGTSTVLTASVCNLAPVLAAGDVCLINSLRVVGDDASSFSLDPPLASVTVRPGACAPIAIKAFADGRSGIRDALLEFASSDPSRVRVQLPLSFSVP
jgi:hypothetical protein